jgi:hypothetical protein
MQNRAASSNLNLVLEAASADRFCWIHEMNMFVQIEEDSWCISQRCKVLDPGSLHLVLHAKNCEQCMSYVYVVEFEHACV